MYSLSSASPSSSGDRLSILSGSQLPAGKSFVSSVLLRSIVNPQASDLLTFHNNTISFDFDIRPFMKVYGKGSCMGIPLDQQALNKSLLNLQ